MRIEISDDLADQIQALVPTKPLAELVTFQLQRFVTVSPRDRVLLIRPPERHALEVLLGTKTLGTAQELYEAIQSQTAITYGGVQIEFTKPQLREIETRARKNQRSLEDEIRSMAAETAKLMLSEV